MTPPASPGPPSAQATPWLRLRDDLGVFYADERFVPLFPTQGQPAEASWRLALVLVLQFAENLTDRQAADAVRGVRRQIR